MSVAFFHKWFLTCFLMINLIFFNLVTLLFILTLLLYV